MYHLYILKCSDNTLYTGITVDLERRVNEHNGLKGAKIGAKYTASRRPVVLMYSKKYRNRSTASKAEAKIKKLSRMEKMALLKNSIEESA